jgi:OPA family sugar phosphate sensor protein UhpC-like MFS transporter
MLHLFKNISRDQWAVFLSATFGYGFFYVTRLSFNLTKNALTEEGIFTTSEIGYIGSALFFTYAVGKLVNGMIADRVNVRYLMSLGLFASSAINLLMGFSETFFVFALLWGLNGWFQSMGAPSSVVSISRWFSGKNRGSFYGMWSSSHNIGEAITFLVTAVVVSYFGWQWGFRAAGFSAMLVAVFVFIFLKPHPIPAQTLAEQKDNSLSKVQLSVFTNVNVWVLALASASFYITRYGINSWGVFFLQNEKGYTLIEAGSIISVNAIFGIIGTFFSGILSDRFFAGKRNMPVLLFGGLYTLSTALFVYAPANWYIDSLAMALFGLALGALLVYLGGLMVVDICPKNVSGTALGFVGIASYLGAGAQDIISGIFIEDGLTVVDSMNSYDFDQVKIFWVLAALVSTILPLFVWRVKYED